MKYYNRAIILPTFSIYILFFNEKVVGRLKLPRLVLWVETRPLKDSIHGWWQFTYMGMERPNFGAEELWFLDDML